MTQDVRDVVREDAMSRFQVIAVTVCMAINALDGFDVLSIAFTGPRIAKEWMLAPTELGLLFSAGLAGMMLGALLLSPLADLIGRRFLVLLGLIVITAGMALSGLARGLEELAILRLFTGLGIGSLLSSINTIVMEYASRRRKVFAVAFMSVGYPIGATIGGTIAVFLIADFGWRSVFFFGASLSAALIPIVLVTLPESLDFLLAKRRSNALARVNALLQRMGRAELTELPPPNSAQTEARGVLAGFDKAFFWRTLLICTAYFLTMLPFYFMLNWTPKVLVDEGLSLSTGISGAVIMNGAGVFGGLLFGAVASRLGLRPLTSVFMVLFFGSIAGFGAAGTTLPLLLGLAAAVGFFMIGVISGLYAVIGAMYPVRVRNTGTGLALGIGRLGAVAGPYLGGVLIAAGWSRPVYCAVLAAPLLLAALVIRRVPLLDGKTEATAPG
ncbi:MAG: MFS transporter [Rhizomicrobium sp.]